MSETEKNILQNKKEQNAENIKKLKDILHLMAQSPKYITEDMDCYMKNHNGTETGECINWIWEKLAKEMFPELEPEETYMLSEEITDIKTLYDMIKRGLSSNERKDLMEALKSCPDDSPDAIREYGQHGIKIEGHFKKKIFLQIENGFRIPKIILNPWYPELSRVIFYDHIETLAHMPMNPEHLIPANASTHNINDIFRLMECRGEDGKIEHILSDDTVKRILWFADPDYVRKVKWHKNGAIKMLRELDRNKQTLYDGKTLYDGNMEHKKIWLDLITDSDIETWNNTEDPEKRKEICQRIYQKTEEIIGRIDTASDMESKED